MCCKVLARFPLDGLHGPLSDLNLFPVRKLVCLWILQYVVVTDEKMSTPSPGCFWSRSPGQVSSGQYLKVQIVVVVFFDCGLAPLRWRTLKCVSHNDVLNAVVAVYLVSCSMQVWAWVLDAVGWGVL